MDTIRAIIFDLDGVICFTDNYHYQAWKELADAEGIYFDEKINGRLRGVSRMESLDIILERASRCYTQEEKEQLATRKNESYVRLLEKMSPRDLSDEVKNKPAPCGNGMGLADIRTKQAFIWIFGELFRHVRKLNPWIKMKFGYKIKNFINICKTVHRCTVCFLIVHMQII